MPFREQKHKCREALERALHEYVDFYENNIAHKCIDDCPEIFALWKMHARLVEKAHDAYHIAIELDTGHERDWNGEKDHANPRHISTAATTAAR